MLIAPRPFVVSPAPAFRSSEYSLQSRYFSPPTDDSYPVEPNLRSPREPAPPGLPPSAAGCPPWSPAARWLSGPTPSSSHHKNRMHRPPPKQYVFYLPPSVPSVPSPIQG